MTDLGDQSVLVIGREHYEAPGVLLIFCLFDLYVGLHVHHFVKLYIYVTHFF